MLHTQDPILAGRQASRRPSGQTDLPPSMPGLQPRIQLVRLGRDHPRCHPPSTVPGLVHPEVPRQPTQGQIRSLASPHAYRPALLIPTNVQMYCPNPRCSEVIALPTDEEKRQCWMVNGGGGEFGPGSDNCPRCQTSICVQCQTISHPCTSRVLHPRSCLVIHQFILLLSLH